MGRIDALNEVVRRRLRRIGEIVPAAAIIGVGSYLPEEIRRNDYWPKEVIAEWPKKMIGILDRDEQRLGFPITEGVRKALDGLRAFASDPFWGISERRAMPQGMTPTDMEVHAAHAAMRNAGIQPRDVELLLAHSMVATYQTYNQAVPIHLALGLSDQCMCSGVDAVCNTFITQLTLAADSIASGRVRHALLVQSSAVSRIQDNTDWSSAFLGDGATAVVLGPAEEGKGLLATSHRVDSRNHLGIVTGVPNAYWYEDGRSIAMVLDKAAVRRTFFQTNDLARLSLEQALEKAGIRAEDVAFYACHQMAGNMRQQTQEMVGMSKARFVDTLPWAGTLSSANIPLQLDYAQKDHILREGDVVAMFSMGAGTTASAAVLRW